MKVGDLKITYRENTSDEDVIHHSFDNDIFLTGMPEYVPSRDDIVLDVGAHIGTFSLLLANQVKQIFAIEPSLESFEVLNSNIKGNRIQNVKLFQIALSEQTGEAKLYYDVEHGNWGHSITKEFSEAGEIVKTISLDDFFEKNLIKRCDFIKFNCEGAEFDILLSASEKTLNKIDKMLVLYHADLNTKYSLQQLLSFIGKNGFYTEIRKQEKDKSRGWIICCKANWFQKILFSSRYIFKRVTNKMSRIFSSIKR